MISLRLSTKIPQMRAILNNELNTKIHNLNYRQIHTTRSVYDVEAKEKPIKFTTSDAHLNYRASKHFYEEPRNDIPRSHNIMVAATGITGIFYIIFIRDDIDDNEGALSLAKPVFEMHPQFAIPMIESMIIEHRKDGRSTKELEKKLAFYMKNPEAHGGITSKKTLVEN